VRLVYVHHIYDILIEALWRKLGVRYAADIHDRKYSAMKGSRAAVISHNE
jgi:hypothetical protein